MTIIALAPNVHILAAEKGSLHVDHNGRQLVLSGIGGLEAALSQLGKEPSSLAELAALAAQDQERGSQAAFEHLCRALLMIARRRLLAVSCVVGTHTLLTAVPAGQLCAFDFGASQLDRADPDGIPGQDGPVRLSKFACAHQVEGQLVVECPHRSIRVTVRAPEIGAMIAALADPATAAEIENRLGYIAPLAVREATAFLLTCGVLCRIDATGRAAEDSDPLLAQREFHDVLLHAHSRSGLSSTSIGGTFPFAGVIQSTAAVKPPMSADLLQLPAPDLRRLTRDDPPLAKVMEDRRSIRQHADLPLTIDQLGEFLYRVGRVRSLRPSGQDPRQYEMTHRTYPSGGATYDLEIYPVVRECEGLDAGFYHYEPTLHSLARLAADPALINAMQQYAYFANGRETVPQVLFVISSRFSRVTWKYRGISYATTLRNVGVLYEAMYLAATAMGLAPCALGAGDSAVFNSATSLDPLVESSVGEFMLGTPRS